MHILLFGKTGQIGRSLCDAAQGKAQITALSRADADCLAAGAAAHAIEAHGPDVVINAAAYTKVDKAEDETRNAARLNTGAPGEMAGAAKSAGARFIHLSTDFVFSGKADAPYGEDAPTDPLSVYGRTKRDGENAVLEANDDAIIIRTSWVFSQYGENFVKTMLRLGRQRDEIRVVADQLGAPTHAGDIAQALLAIAGKISRGAPGKGVYHFQGAPAVSWAGFAAKIFEYAGNNTRVVEIATAQYPTPAQRPAYSILDCARIERHFGIAQPDWRIGLRQVVKALNDR